MSGTDDRNDPEVPPRVPTEVLPEIGDAVERLADPGWAVIQEFLPADEADDLARACRRLWDEGEFRHAGVGIGAERTVQPEVRSDRVLWLTDEVIGEAGTPVRRYLDRIETLRRELNRHLYLGLFDFEAHFTVYPPGAFYRKHLDRFRTVPLRTVSAILYLNPHWTPRDGGQLRIYLDSEGRGEAETGGGPDGEAGATVDVVPRAGTLALFLSERFWHEVLPAERERMSVTGWLKRRG